MAKRAASGVSKPDAIRSALREHSDKGPSEIAVILQKQGVDVTASYISVVKSSLKSKRRGQGKRVLVRANSDRVSVRRSPLAAAVEFVRAVGGIEAAKQAIASIEEIQSLS